MSDCIFCKIISGSIPAAKLHEDAECIVIQDIQPQAKVHWLVIPKEHLASLDAAYSGRDASSIVGALFKAAAALARAKGLMPGGYRTVINTGPNGCQSVFHLHVHVLGGEQLSGEMA